MREILFRGKRTDNGEWIEGEVLRDGLYGKYYFKNKNDCLDDNLYEVEESEEDGFLQLKAYEVDPETVCQYTGLTDKNGRKIFEGDCLGHELNVVEYMNGCYTVSGDRPLSLMAKYNEVIGNIFDKE